MEIRSYRRVFDLERRIYRIDRVQLNPSGVPLRGVVYFLVLLAACTLAGRLPLVALVPWYLRELVLPGACAALLTAVRIEGRPFHLAGYALARFGLGPRRLTGLRPYRAHDRSWRPVELVLIPDGSDARLRRMRYRGPGTVLVRCAHVRYELPHGGAARRIVRRADLAIAPLPGRRAPVRGVVLALAAGGCLRVDASRVREERVG